MEQQKIINLLDNTRNEPSKFRTKNWVEINDNVRGAYNTNCQIKLKSSMLKSSFCDYSSAYIFVSGTKQSLEQQQMMQQNERIKEKKE